MKATGIVRRVDPLGRIVLPIELRRSIAVAEHDPLEIYVDGGDIILRKYRPGCVFCGCVVDLVNSSGKVVCRSCLSGLNHAAL